MFGIGTTELIIILLAALIILGPAKLPGIARSLGKALGEFRRVTTDVQRTFNLEAARMEEEEKEKTKTKAKAKTKADASEEQKKQEDVPPPEAADPDPYSKKRAESGSETQKETPPSTPDNSKSEEKA